MENLNYTFNDTHQKEILSRDEVYFFYYDMMRDTEDSIQAIYEWNDKIEKFLDERGINIKETVNSSIPHDIENNDIYFSVSKNENKPEAFFRHLRNAFVHHRIVHYGEYLCIRDMNEHSLTMNGKIKYQDLKEFCRLFFEQRAEFENAHNL